MIMNGVDEHVGEYIRAKLRQRGLTQARIAQVIGIPSQTFSKRLEQHDWKTKQLMEIEKATGDPHFFDDFFNTSGLKRYRQPMEDTVDDHPTAVSGATKGYRISLEIDPEVFDPDDFHQITRVLSDTVVRLKQVRGK